MKNNFLILALIFTLSFTGCWDRRELNELGIVLALAVDKDDKTGEIMLTSQVVRPSALAKDGGSAGEAPVAIVTTKGRTVFEAIRDGSKEFDRRNYFTNIKVLVIDEKLAREGVAPVLDMFIRAREIRPLVWVIIAKDTKARNIIGVDDGVEQVQATYLNNIIKQRTLHSQASVNNLLDFSRMLLAGGIDPTTGVMRIRKKSTLPVEQKGKTGQEIRLEGTAVFKQDKLVGYLNEAETRGLNWVNGKVDSGIINVLSPTKKDTLVSIEIKDAQSKIKPQVKDGKISFTIEVEESGDVFEQQNGTDFTKQHLLSKIEQEQEVIIAKEIKQAIEKAQKELGADIFGFGSILSRKYPAVWKQVQKDWDKVFQTVAYTVKVDAKVRTTVLLLKPITP